MSEEKNTESTPQQKTDEAPGFFKRIFTKIDQSMKDKADAKARSSCCGGKDGKGGKCC